MYRWCLKPTRGDTDSTLNGLEGAETTVRWTVKLSLIHYDKSGMLDVTKRTKDKVSFMWSCVKNIIPSSHHVNYNT